MKKQFLSTTLFLLLCFAISCTCSQTVGGHPVGSQIILQGPQGQQITRVVTRDGSVNVPCEGTWTVTS